MPRDIDNGNANKIGSALWTVQIVLALVFLFAGGMKLVLPTDELVKQTPLPALFLRFIGLCEVSGALGLILPGVFGVRRGLTPLAAAGLAIIMIGATVLTLAQGQVGPALVPVIVGSLGTFVAYRHRRLAMRAARLGAQVA